MTGANWILGIGCWILDICTFNKKPFAGNVANEEMLPIINANIQLKEKLRPDGGIKEMKCFSCGEELFDNGDERFRCPYCGAEVSRSQTVSSAMQQDDDSSNRANRSEFWLKTLLLLVFVGAVIIFGKSFEAKLPICLGIALIGACVVVTLFYAFGVVRRRLHDFGWSGWWILLYVLLQNVFKNVSRSFYDDVWSWVELVALILVGVLPGTPGRNEYGAQPPPKQFPFWPWR